MALQRMDNVGIVVDDLAPTVADHRNAPVNALGYLRIMFAVDDIDDGEVVQYEDAYRLCYTPGPGGLLIGLAQNLAEPN
jgi:hypothetical protein